MRAISAASCSKDDHAKGREVMDINLAMLKEDDHAEVRAIVEKGFAQLMDWLDLRLQQQEDNLRSLLTAQEPRKSQGSAKMEPQVMSQEQALKRFPPTSESLISQQTAQRQGMVLDGQARIQSTMTQAAVSRVTSATSTIPYKDPEQLWVSSLVGIFDQLDLAQTGCIDLRDFKIAFHETGFSDMQAMDIFRSFDESGNGTIDRLEWLQMVSQSESGSDDEMKLLKDFLSRLVKLQRSQGTVYRAGRARRVDWILRHDSVWRVMWDVMLTLLLFYVAVSVPVSLGFGSVKAMDDIDLVLDLIFCCDVALNFRTSYTDQDDTVVVDWKKIGIKYLKSWFVVDFFSSVPFEFITMGAMPDLTPVRLLKFFKVAKVLKVLRIAKIGSFKADSETVERLKIRLSSRPCARVLRMLRLISIAFLFAHWLTCFCFAVDSSAFDEYFDSLGQVPNALQKYLAGMYWAMTTISTVGYGDITPNTDQERAFSMIAMIVGGSLYGFWIGSVTSIVTDNDKHMLAYHERMEVLQSWLDRHRHIPLLLRRRLRKYFKSRHREKTVIDDRSVVDQLAGELRGDTAFFLIDDNVRRHPMVVNLSNSSLAELVYVIQETHARAHEFIVRMDDPGIGMYFLVEGLARYDQGLRWQPPSTQDTPDRFQQILKGESFGEEIIFGLAETYAYTVITILDCSFKWIDETCFREHFKNLPDLWEHMYATILTPDPSSLVDASGSNEFIVEETTATI